MTLNLTETKLWHHRTSLPDLHFCIRRNILGKAFRFLCKMLKMSCKLLKSRDGTSWFDSLLEFLKQSALEKAEKPESKPNEKTRKFSHFSDRLRLIDACINVFEDSYLKEKQAEIRKGIMRSLSAIWRSWRRNMHLFIVRSFAHNFFMLSPRTVTSPRLFIGHFRWWFR
jgi:hypothetical protein